MLAAVVVLVGGSFAGWKYFHSRSSAKPPKGSITTQPTQPANFSKPKEQTTVNPRKPVPTSAAPAAQGPVGRKSLSYEEQARVIELDSLANIYYGQGGCEKALPTYQQVLEIDPGDHQAYAAVQKCYAKARNGVGIIPVPTPTIPPATPPQP
jgi:tetratricopeptide (TPR) repeat protein